MEKWQEFAPAYQCSGTLYPSGLSFQYIDVIQIYHPELPYQQQRLSWFVNSQSESAMKLSKYFYPAPALILIECTFIHSMRYKHLYDVENFEPIQYVDFDLLSEDQNSDSQLSRSRYNVYENGEPKTKLPLLSRGERDIDDDDFEDNVKVPSCSELRKMWKIARRIHHHAIKTNEIPQKLHPFSDFESDRFRAAQRLKNKLSKYKNRKNKSHKQTKGSKEVTDTNFGIVR